MFAVPQDELVLQLWGVAGVCSIKKECCVDCLGNNIFLI
jgi:hypothetical protein